MQDKMFAQMHSRFGDEVMNFWLYESDRCLGCGRHDIIEETLGKAYEAFSKSSLS